MTTSRPVTCCWSMPSPQRARLELDGELDYDGADRVVDEVAGHLAEHPGLRELTLDCRGVGFCDSSGLSALLMIRRRADAAGVRLELANRGPALERLLRVTNTLKHLTGGPAASREEQLDP